MNFPKSTILNRFVAKTKFYERIGLTEKQKTAFQTEIERITWTHKFSPDTLNIAACDGITEIEVFEIRLKRQNISESVLKIINDAIPYSILFILKTPQEQLQAAMRCEKRYFSTEWTDCLTLQLTGITTRQIRDNFLIQINPMLKYFSPEQIEQRENIQKQIATLTAKINREPQENKRHELAELRRTLQLKILTSKL